MMKKITNILIGILSMGGTSLLALLIISLLTYGWKWQADKAMLGITFTYIIAGFAGGLSMKWMPRIWKRWHTDRILTEEGNIGVGGKMLESLLAGTIFMLILMMLSAFFAVNEIQITSRFFLIWMLLAGSTALGRIL